MRVGAGDDVRDGWGELPGSEVRSPRSLMVSFCGFAVESGCGRSRWECCDRVGGFDSSDELSVASGVESESKRGMGERRFVAR